MAASVAQNEIIAMRRFNRFYTKAIGALKRGLHDSKFSLTEVRVLYELAYPSASAPLTAAALCQLLDLDTSYCSRLLRNFESRELLSRKPSRADARVMQLRLTAKGARALAALERATDAQTSAMLARLATNDRGNLLASMQTIEDTLRPVTERAAPRESAPSAVSDMSPRYRLRSHRPGDMGWVISRHGALYAQAYGWDESFEAMVAQICARFILKFDPERECCWIAEDDSGLIGSVFVVKKSATTAKLRMLIVEPRARGMKLGAKLVDEAIAFARARGYKKMTLWTNDILHAARHIYVARGFKLVKEESHRSFGKDLAGQYWDLSL